MSYRIDCETNGMVEHRVWEHGAKKPWISDHSQIIYLQATDDALDYIRITFINLPHVQGMCVWRGYLARFIYDNL